MGGTRSNIWEYTDNLWNLPCDLLAKKEVSSEAIVREASRGKLLADPAGSLQHPSVVGIVRTNKKQRFKSGLLKPLKGLNERSEDMGK